MPILEKAKCVYKDWIPLHRNLPRTERFGIGTKIDFLFLDLLELLRKSAYSQVTAKIGLLENAADKIDSLRFFTQLLWETNLVSNDKFISMGTAIDELGKMVGGWKRGLINKTSAVKAEERRG